MDLFYFVDCYAFKLYLVCFLCPILSSLLSNARLAIAINQDILVYSDNSIRTNELFVFWRQRVNVPRYRYVSITTYPSASIFIFIAVATCLSDFYPFPHSILSASYFWSFTCISFRTRFWLIAIKRNIHHLCYFLLAKVRLHIKYIRKI